MSDDPTEETPACACRECVAGCARPGWPSPGGAAAMLDAGLARRMMADWWEGNGKNVYVLCPANPGCGGEHASDEGGTFFSPYTALQSGCVFQRRARGTAAYGECELHGSVHKPLECRAASHSESGERVQRRHEAVAAMWDTEEGRAVYARWCQQCGLDP